MGSRLVVKARLARALRFGEVLLNAVCRHFSIEAERSRVGQATVEALKAGYRRRPVHRRYIVIWQGYIRG
jgi:hypothetical protein